MDQSCKNALDLDDCFSTTGGGGEQIVDFWVNYISGTAYIKSTYIKVSFVQAQKFKFLIQIVRIKKGTNREFQVIEDTTRIE